MEYDWLTMKKREFKRLIKAAGNQSRLAELLGVSRQFVSQIKVGRAPFPKSKLPIVNNLLSQEANP